MGGAGFFSRDQNRHPVTYTKRCSSIYTRQVLFHGTPTRNIYVTTNATHLLVTEEYISKVAGLKMNHTITTI
jgi:hypothetical protein